MADLEKIVIMLPIPDRKLHPNARSHYRELAPVKRKHRENACLITKAICPEPKQWNQIVVRPIFVFKDKRYRDVDGMIASLKAYIDGIADAGLIENDHFLQWLPPKEHVDKDNAHLELHFYHGTLKDIPDEDLINPPSS